MDKAVKCLINADRGQVESGAKVGGSNGRERDYTGVLGELDFYISIGTSRRFSTRFLLCHHASSVSNDGCLREVDS